MKKLGFYVFLLGLLFVSLPAGAEDLDEHAPDGATVEQVALQSNSNEQPESQCEKSCRAHAALTMDAYAAMGAARAVIGNMEMCIRRCK